MSKDNEYFNSQLQAFYNYLFRNVCTVAMASKALSISEKNLCRHKATLEKAGRIFIVKREKCEHTGFLANYLSTNPIHAPQSQMKLFEC